MPYMMRSYQRNTTKGNLGKTVALTTIYLLFLYSFLIPGLPFGSVFFSLGVLAVYTAYSFVQGPVKLGKTKASKMVRLYIYWHLFLLLYVFVILQLHGSGDGTTPIKDYILMLIILPLFYISGNLICSNIEELMKALYIGAIIQSIIIILALFIPILTMALTLFFPEGSYNSDKAGGMEYAIAEGYKIGLGVYSSAGSLKMAIGQIGACYFLINSRGTKLCFHLLIYMIIAVAVSMVARTGLLVSALGLLCVFLTKRKQGHYKGFKFVSLTLFIIVVGYFLAINVFSSNFLDDTFQRIINTAENGIHETYFRGYSGEGGTNKIPPLSSETLIGLGITYGVSGSGITTITDGGFMRNYSAMGLIVAIINYLIIGHFFFKQYKMCKTVEYRGIILFMSLILLIGEFKESFIYYISPMCFFFLIFSLIEKDEITIRCVSNEF